MTNPGCKRIVTICTLFLIVGGELAGCSGTTRRDVLTFFFTGVPPEGQQQEQVARPAVSVFKKTRRAFIPKSQFFVHGPFGAGQCGKCHALRASKPFRTARAEPADTAASEQRSIGPRLAYPLEELCTTCHADKHSTAATDQGLWMHGPVANGWCVVCHSPHKSARQYMLLKGSNIELCTGCHDKNDLLSTAAHAREPETDCISCHNPHLGKNSFLLRSSLDEWRLYDGSE